jgi:hypothetical protein
VSAIDPVTEHDCLADPDDLEEVEDDRPGVTVRVCSVCGRRHIEMEADPFQVGVELS